MSREPPRKSYFSRDPRNRHPDWSRPDYRDRERGRPLDRRSRSPPRDLGKRRSRSPLPRKDKDVIDENILSEISKLPEPSELWEGNQFQDASGYAPPPPSFSQEPVGNPAYGSAPSYQASYSGIYDDFPPVASIPTPRPPEISSWNQMSLPPPPTPAPPPTFLSSTEDQKKKEAAIESEMRHQKAALSKQREDYMKKASILKKELDTLKDQRNELRGDSKRSPSPDTKRFLKENTKLQLEIQNKLKTINNVVDMLNGIIGEEAQELPSDLDNSPDRSSKRKSRSPSAGQKYNYVYYDPEMHWCRVCNEFPPTAKDYLNHLHSAAHHKMAAAHLEAPWHTVSGLNEGFPNYASAPTKRTPIKGLQFFVPSTAWYCKLCDQFIGDLHCASAHLKSVTHSKNYTNFVEQNPHWETDWMSDRQKAFEKARASVKTKPPPEEKPGYTPHTIAFNKDGFHTKKKDSPPPTEEKKKKKEKKKKNKKKRNSSSSSSSSSSSDSEPVKKKKKKKDKKHSSDADDKNSLSQWVTSIHGDRLTENDLKLLDSLKNRIKMDKLAEEKLKSPDRSRERENAKRSSRDNEHHEAREARNRDVRDRERDRDRERERELRDREREQRERDREREQREREREQRERERERERRARPSPPRTESKKPEIRKMPFIGKMPVYKSLGKTKAEEQKKEEEKKKEEDEANKKRREEMDAEIQKKVAEFKEKIAKAQLERAQQLDLPPPAVALPTALGQAAPPAFLPAPPAPAPAPVPPQPPPPATPAPAPALPKDFQDALEIIFPSSEAKPEMPQQELFSGFPPGFMPGIGMPSFPPFLQPQMPPQMVMGFDMNGPMFPGPRPPAPLFEQHQHLVGQKLRPTKNNNSNNNRGNNKHNPYQNKNQNQYRQNQNKNQNNQNQKGNHNQNQSQRNQQNQKQQQNQSNTKTQSNTKAPTPTKAETKANGDAAKKKEELDDLAMLGIDASDVGAGM